MPIYEYACPDCGHKFDEIQKFSDDPITICPKCAQANVKKLISQTSFILKGGGWYKDHYGLKPAADSGGDAKSAKGEGKTDGKDSSSKDSGGSKDGGSKDGGSAPAASAPTSAPASSGSAGTSGSSST